MIEQLHRQSVREAISKARQSILEGMEKVLSDERVENNIMLDPMEHIDQLLPEALAIAKTQTLTIPSLQRTFN